MSNIQNCSFKGYIPVRYFAKNPKDNEYVRVMKDENVRKCNGFVVRNLNRTAKNIKNQEFVNQYKEMDRDYRSIPVVKSVYDDKSPLVFLVTGRDVDAINNLAKPVGIAKHESIDRIGTAKSFESKNAAKDYFRKAKGYILNLCKRVKNKEGIPVFMDVYFNPQYNKKGELTGFKYVESKFTPIDV